MTRLSARLVGAIALVAVLVGLIVGAMTAPLLDDASRDSARASASRQADLLARFPARVLAAGVADQIADRRGLNLGVLLPDGAADGPALALTSSQADTVLTGSAVSTEGSLAGHDVLLEARSAPDGGAVVVAAEPRDDGTFAKLRRRVATAIGVGVAIALALGSALASRLGKPLRDTASAAQRLAAGERGVPMPRSSTAEVAAVCEGLGALDMALAASENRQRQFLMSVSHELRTPLTAIRGYGEALVDGVIAPDEAMDVGETLRQEALRLERYVEDLLALARLDADDFTVERVPVDLADLASRTVGSWRSRAEAASLSIVAEIPAAPLWCNSDPHRVRQVLDALIDNAVRVCPPGSRVVVATEPTNAGPRVEVRDSGPGLSDDDARVAFEPGVLHARYAGQRPVNHGLGLAIVHRLVGRLGGEIHVEHAAEGGASFVVTLPR